MHPIYRHELTKQVPPAPDYAEMRTPFHNGNGNGEGAIAGKVYEILTLAFTCFDTWLEPLFSQAERRDQSRIELGASCGG